MSSNIIKPEAPELAHIECPTIEGGQRIRESYEQYLSDESRMEGEIPARIYFPRTTLEAASAMSAIAARGEKVTILGSRTGIVGGAVNRHAENIISLENIVFKCQLLHDAQADEWSIRVGAGMKLEGLLTAIKKKDYECGQKTPNNLFYPVDPTEQSASMGGIVAANASGARTLYYGATREWVKALTIVMSDGRVLNISRGEVFAEDGCFRLQGTDDGQSDVPVSEIAVPRTKHVAGYFLKNNMDLVDLFIAGEGTLGIITEIEFRLCRLPAECLYLSVFMQSCDSIVDLVAALKASDVLHPFALEYMDSRSVDLLLEFREELAQASGVPAFPGDVRGILYLEIGFDGDNMHDKIYAELESILGRFGITTESTWAGYDRKDLDAMKKFRHALPERVNSIIAQRKTGIPEITKVGTDMAVPDERLGEILAAYYELLDAEKLEFVVFGHIGDAHLHVNILPRTLVELKAAKKIYVELARKVVALGGSVAAEHGIGKLKKEFMKIQYGEEDINAMKLVKEALDPTGALNPEVLFDTEK